MAFTQSLVKRTVKGDMVEEIWTGTLTGVTSGNLVTGVSNIEGISVQPDTFRDGATVDHTSTPGTVALGSFTNGDVVTVSVSSSSKS